MWARGCVQNIIFGSRYAQAVDNSVDKFFEINVVIPTLTRHNGYKEVKVEEELCKCGINYETWVAYDIKCVDDDLHLWEEE